jgi:ABC-type multidrug transport system fused ATPase/permease subunit
LKFIRKVISKVQEGLLKKLLEEWTWIAGYMRRYVGQMLLYVGLGISGTLMGLAGSVVSKYLIDAVTGFHTGSIGWIAALYVGMGLVNIGTGALTSRISVKVTTKVHQEIRADIFDRVLLTDWESLAAYHSGDLLNRANGDAGAVAGTVLSFVPNIVTSLVQFIGALAIILYYDPVMALIALSSAPVLVLSSRFLMRKMRQFQLESRKISSEIMVFNQEAFQNIQFIKSFDLIRLFSDRMRDFQLRSYEFTMRHNLFSIATSSTMSLIGRIISYVIYGWGVYRLWQGDITYGTMTLFIQMAGSLSGSFSSLVNVAPQMLSAGTSARRVMDIVELEREQHGDDKRAETLQAKAQETGVTVSLKDVAFAYKNGQQVFSGVNLKAAPGEIVALVGPSGEGKTTMLRLLLGLVIIREGEGLVSIGDGSGDSLPISPSTRRLFTYVPQGNMLFSLSIGTDEQIITALRMACIDQVVLGLPEGINSKIGERGHGFSEGQGQRISIARALLSDAPVLLLDEATSALDITTERNVLRNILEKDRQKTIILTTHRPSVLCMCNRAYRVGEHKVEIMDDMERQRYMQES